MKKQLILWCVAVAGHTYLFYEQVQGYNTTIFALLILTLGAISRKEHRLSPIWWLAAGIHLMVALSISWHGGGMTQLLYASSLFVLMGMTYSPKSSLYIAWMNGLFAAICVSLAAYFTHFKDFFKSFFIPIFKPVVDKRPSLFLMPFSITLGFYFLYSWANPDFWIDFSFLPESINFLFIGFVVFGFVWICPFFFPWGNQELVDSDTKASNSLKRVRYSKKNTPILALKYENQQGVVLFVLLNLLISIFLGFNLLQLFIPTLQAQSKGYSVQVHEGFNALLVSILSAIGLIMYYFRANQNFYQPNQRLLQLAIIWILLNALLVFFTFYKNALYVVSFGLTFKRIWVYISLGLTVGGLLLTFIKLTLRKSNRYLLRQNIWMIYIVMACYGLIDWSRLITWYNLNYAHQLDIAYIQKLGSSKLPYLQTLIQLNDKRIAPFKDTIAHQISYWKKLIDSKKIGNRAIGMKNG
ncbi:MAG: DUF4153 domain-containing protein [Spirosomataceae bacterium]